MNELIKEDKKEEGAVYPLMQREDKYCINCKVPSVHYRLYEDSIRVYKFGNDWHVSCEGVNICILPQKCIKKIFEDLRNIAEQHRVLQEPLLIEEETNA